jgi:conjugal transfer pilus assembly protein TraD
MKDRTIFVFWRRCYELLAGVFWMIGALVTALYAYYGNFGFRFLFLASIPMFFIGGYRLIQANKLLSFKAKTISLPDLSVSIDQLIKWQTKDKTKSYQGHGFAWGQLHAQMLEDYYTREKKHFDPGSWYMSIRSMLGLVSKYNEAKDTTTIAQGVGKEAPIFLPVEDRFGHRGVGGSTGTGKGRVLTIDIVNSIARGEPGIIIDPKLDKVIVDAAYATLKKQGRESYFYYFNPNTPASSVRLDLLGSYGTLGQLATRIITIIPPGGDDTFKNFAWRAVNAIVHAISIMGEKVTLVKVREAIEQDMSYLVKRAGVYYLSNFDETRQISQAIDSQADTGKAADMVLSTYYAVLKDIHPNRDIESLFGIYSQDQKHYQKLIQNIIPQLTQLTQGDMRDLLSHDPDDGDQRPIISLKMVANTNGVLYINLSSLSDSELAASLGSLLLNDAINLTADRFYYSDQDSLMPLSVWIDEASEVLNASAVKMLNKSRAARVAITLAYQTTSDFQVRLGSLSASEQAFGNMNSKLQLRAVDASTKQYMSDQMGTTTISSINHTLSTQSTTMTSNDFTTGYNKTINTTKEPLVSLEAIGGLSNLSGFLVYDTSLVMKLRVPFIEVPEEDCFVKPTFGPSQFGLLPNFEALTSQATGSLSFQEGLNS